MSGDVMDSLGVTDGISAGVVNVTVGGEVTNIKDALIVTAGGFGVMIVAIEPETWVVSLVVIRLSSSSFSASFSLLHVESRQHLTWSLKIPQREPCSQ